MGSVEGGHPSSSIAFDLMFGLRAEVTLATEGAEALIHGCDSHKPLKNFLSRGKLEKLRWRDLQARER
jgi:hypothetical protein